MKDRFFPIFITMVALTSLCGIIAIGIAILAPDPASPLLDRAFDASIRLFMLGTITIIIGFLNNNKSSNNNKSKLPKPTVDGERL